MDGISVDSIVKIINAVGFPIVVAIWFMWRSDKRQDKIIELVQELSAFEKAKKEYREK
ncbi:hypothetical protein MASR1M48_16330 [Lactococcus petauri]